MKKLENKTDKENTPVKGDTPAKEKSKISPVNLIFEILTGLVLLAVIIIAINAFLLNKKIKDFRQFDIKELKSQELIFQTYEFNKFIANTTNQNGGFSEYTDEMAVYYVKGTATISFKNIDKLEPIDAACDYDKGILRLKYNWGEDNKIECPFDVSVAIDPKDIYYVTSKESKNISLFHKEIDLIKAENPAEIIQRAKDEIKKEFEKQLIEPLSAKKDEKSNLCTENDTYAAFLNTLTKMVTSNEKSKWNDVEIFF